MKDGMVVAFHLEDGRVAVADIDHAGVLARALEHPRRFRRQLAQVRARRFVGAVLAPHHGEDAELDEIGLAVHERFNASVLVLGEAVLADDLGRDLGHNLPPPCGEVEIAQRFRVGAVPPTRRNSLRSSRRPPHEGEVERV